MLFAAARTCTTRVRASETRPKTAEVQSELERADVHRTQGEDGLVLQHDEVIVPMIPSVLEAQHPVDAVFLQLPTLYIIMGIITILVPHLKARHVHHAQSTRQAGLQARGSR